jgi:hypothetical protein
MALGTNCTGAIADPWRYDGSTPPLLGRAIHAVRIRVLELVRNGKYLGATLGIITTLHTWSPTLILHPHLQCLVTGGGLMAGGHWVAVRNGFWLPMRVVMALFRRNLGAICQRLQQGRLWPRGGLSRQPLDNRLHKVGRAKWKVHLRKRYPHG